MNVLRMFQVAGALNDDALAGFFTEQFELPVILAEHTRAENGDRALTVHLESGRLQLMIAAQAKKAVSALKKIAVAESDKDFWCCVEMPESQLFSGGKPHIMPGSARSFSEQDWSLFVTHVKMYLGHITLTMVLENARKMQQKTPELRFGQCVFNALPAYITSQLIGTPLDMFELKDVGKSTEMARTVAERFGLPIQ